MGVEIHHLPFATLPVVKRNDKIVNLVIAGPKQGTRNIKSGITRMRAGSVVPRHSHNCEEQVTVLEGRLRLVLGERVVECGPYDSTYISAGVQHEFSNIGDGEALVMVIYGASRVTRTFADTGETVDVGSERDVFPPPPPETRPVKA
ncbi:MAG: cupin domain-containing protein [Burkholderiales bacterium]